MNNKDQIVEILRQVSGQANILTVPRLFVILLENDHLAALFLSQCIYWSDRTKRKDGFFYKSVEEWKDETLLTRHQVERITQKLCRLGYIVTELHRANGAPTTHYKVNMRRITADLLKSGNQISGFQQMDLPEISKSDLPEISKSDLLKSGETLTNTTNGFNSSDYPNLSENSAAQSVPLHWHLFMPHLQASDAFKEAWAAWLVHQHELTRADLGSMAAKKQAALLNTWNADKAAAVIENSIGNNYRALVEPKANGKAQAQTASDAVEDWAREHGLH
jgi:hypothetical protein